MARALALLPLGRLSSCFIDDGAGWKLLELLDELLDEPRNSCELQ